jgi:hypothetical protein
MEELIGICGESCHACAIYLATQADDAAERQRVAVAYTSDEYPLTAEDIFCDACHATEGPHFRFCHECPIRLCGLDRGVPTCAHCDHFACEELAASWKIPRTANSRANLEAIRQSLKG